MEKKVSLAPNASNPYLERFIQVVPLFSAKRANPNEKKNG